MESSIALCGDAAEQDKPLQPVSTTTRRSICKRLSRFSPTRQHPFLTDLIFCFILIYSTTILVTYLLNNYHRGTRKQGIKKRSCPSSVIMPVDKKKTENGSTLYLELCKSKQDSFDYSRVLLFDGSTGLSIVVWTIPTVGRFVSMGRRCLIGLHCKQMIDDITGECSKVVLLLDDFVVCYTMDHSPVYATISDYHISKSELFNIYVILAHWIG